MHIFDQSSDTAIPLHNSFTVGGVFLGPNFQDAGLRVIIACRNEALAKQAAATLGCEYEHLEAWIVTPTKTWEIHGNLWKAILESHKNLWKLGHLEPWAGKTSEKI